MISLDEGSYTKHCLCMYARRCAGCPPLSITVAMKGGMSLAQKKRQAKRCGSRNAESKSHSLEGTCACSIDDHKARSKEAGGTQAWHECTAASYHRPPAEGNTVPGREKQAGECSLFPHKGVPFPQVLSTSSSLTHTAHNVLAHFKACVSPSQNWHPRTLLWTFTTLRLSPKLRLHQQPLLRSEAACMLVRPASPHLCYINSCVGCPHKPLAPKLPRRLRIGFHRHR